MSNNEDLHGSAPHKSRAALLIIDMICDFEFEDGEKLFRHAAPITENIVKLKTEAEKADVPVIYVNDNFGKWQSDFRKLLEHSLQKNHRGHEIAAKLKPSEENYFVLKPKHSGFYSTTLEVLLEHFGAKTLILTGVATDICILFTANDAYMRDYKIVVPGDCVAANTEEATSETLKYLERILKAEIIPSARINFRELSQN